MKKLHILAAVHLMLTGAKSCFADNLDLYDYMSEAGKSEQECPSR